MEIKEKLSDSLLNGGVVNTEEPKCYQKILFDNVFYTDFSDQLVKDL